MRWPLPLLPLLLASSGSALPLPLRRARFRGRHYGVAVEADVQLEHNLAVARVTVRGLPLRLRGRRRVEGWARQRVGGPAVLAPALAADLARLNVHLDARSVVFVRDAVSFCAHLPVLGWQHLCLDRLVEGDGDAAWWEAEWGDHDVLEL